MNRLLLLLPLSLVHSQDPFGCSTVDPSAFSPLTLRNHAGLQLTVLPYGGTAQSLLVPTRTGAAVDILLGFDSPESYCTGGPTQQHPYFGALIGRVANRIANCSFPLNGRTWRTPCNEFQAATGLNDTLHGGSVGYDRRVWRVAARSASSLSLELDSLDGEEGFPSSLRLGVTYTLTEPEAGDALGLGAWDVRYTVTNTGSQPSPIAPTQHAYFMLSGFLGGEETVLGHVLRMANATATQAIDAGLIPTGALVSVAQQPWMDFTAG